MMDSSNVGLAAFALNLHALFGISLLVGVVFLVIWAIRAMDKEQLKMWAIWLLVAGVVGTLLTSALGFRSWKMIHGSRYNMMMQGDMMEKLKDGMMKNKMMEGEGMMQ